MIKLISNYSYGQLDLSERINTEKSLYTAILISLTGGNIEANSSTFRQPSGIDNNDWFGNLFQLKSGYDLYNSNFERLLKTAPLISGNLNEFESAIAEDLDWLIQRKIASSFTAEITILTKETVEIIINIEGSKEKYKYLFEV